MDANHLSSFALEAIAQKTRMAPPDAERATSHLEGCEECRLTLAEIHATREAFTRFVAPRTQPEAVRRLGRSRFLAWVPAALVPVFCSLVVVWFVRLPKADELGVKGDASLQVFAQRGDRVFPVGDGDRLVPGDRLRFEVDPGGLPYLLVVSIDAAGHASVYVPFGGAESQRLESEKRFVSPGSIELDPVPGPERVFALLSRTPLRAAEIETSLRQLGQGGPAAIRRATRLQVPADAQRSFLWENHLQ